MSGAAQIKRARVKRGLTQADLGALTGVTKAAVCDWEKGRGVPTTQRLGRLAQVLRPHFDLGAYLSALAQEDAA